jgi:hypothetical protein
VDAGEGELMPFESESQRRLFWAKEKRGELPKGTADRWSHETKDLKHLPMHKRKTKRKKGRAARRS